MSKPIIFQYLDHVYTLTTEHSASSYGQPVVLRNGELTNYRSQVSHHGCGRRSVQLFNLAGKLFCDVNVAPVEREYDVEDEVNLDLCSEEINE
jgi:hypothetical protein